MPSATTQRLYQELLSEIKARIFVVAHLIEGKTRTEGILLPPAIVSELAYLQLRMLCEAVALGCLIAHEDIKETNTKRLQKSYKADEIIEEMERLHPEFFPRAANFGITTGTGGEQAITVDYGKTGWITKAELIDLYRKSGDFLHRGNAKKLSRGSPLHRLNQQNPEFSKIAAYTSKFTNLLNTHTISSADVNRHFLCWLSDANAEGQANVIYAYRGQPQGGKP